jgi:tetratricopeptide (TPR) repeat protein
LALFGKKKPPEEGAAPGGGTEGSKGSAPGDGKFEVHADKARKFFEHAKAVHDATNYEYAMTLWLSGMRQDPTSMAGLEGFFTSAAQFLAAGKKSPSRDMLRQLSGRGDVERYLTGLLDWSLRPLDPALAVRAAENAAKLGLAEPAYWIGERAINAVARDKKPRKDLYLKLMGAFSKVGSFDKAVEAGEAAVRLDPLDGRLSAEVRNLAAQAAMSRGGFDQTGEAGGYRRNIRDAEKQRQLIEQEQIVKSDEAIDRLVAIAEGDYRSRPNDPAAVAVFIKRLRERGRPEDEKRAYQVATQAFEATKEFRFRQIAGEIKLRQAERKVNELSEKAAANPEDATAVDNARRARTRFVEMEVEELLERAKAYPTDLNVKHELARRFNVLGQYDEAIPLLQQSKEDAKLRVDALSQLGAAFLATGYIDEAVYTLREARQHHKIDNDELGLELQYKLLAALQTKAQTERELAAAEEADKIASSIMMQQFNYKDVRTRRDAIKKLIVELKRGDAA